jgi:uncharacterized protein
LDTGLCAYLTQWSSPEALEAGAMSGAIFETWVVLELLKSCWHHGQEAPFYYYRNKDQREIDLVIVKDGKLYPLEFKKSANPGRDSWSSFKTLAQHSGQTVAEGAVVCLVGNDMPLAQGVTAVAAGAW